MKICRKRGEKANSFFSLFFFFSLQILKVIQIPAKSNDRHRRRFQILKQLIITYSASRGIEPIINVDRDSSVTSIITHKQSQIEVNPPPRKKVFPYPFHFACKWVLKNKNFSIYMPWQLETVIKKSRNFALKILKNHHVHRQCFHPLFKPKGNKEHFKGRYTKKISLYIR